MSISCIIGINDNKNFLKRLELVIESLLKQEVEIVISELSPKKSQMEYSEVVHIHTPWEKKFINGLTRNIGAKYASGDFFYFSDSDILFHQEDYFVQLRDLECGIKPQMRRMSIRDVDKFSRAIDNLGYEVAISEIDFSKPYTSRFDTTEIVTFSKFEDGENKTFLTTREELNEFLALGKPKGFEPRYWTMDNHFGALYISRDMFYNIGGYSQDFEVWGCEDDDIIMKLSNPQKIQGEVTHLDHPRNYIGGEPWEKNRRILEARKQIPLQVRIENDRKNL